jgi:hypothetical protein
VFNPAMFCETVRMFMVAAWSMDRSASISGFSALFRNSEFEFRKRNREDNGHRKRQRVETFAGRAGLLEALLY